MVKGLESLKFIRYVYMHFNGIDSSSTLSICRALKKLNVRTFYVRYANESDSEKPDSVSERASASDAEIGRLETKCVPRDPSPVRQRSPSPEFQGYGGG